MDEVERGVRRLIEDIFATKQEELSCDEALVSIAQTLDMELDEAASRHRFPALWQHFRFCPDCAAEYKMLFTLAQAESERPQPFPLAIPPRPRSNQLTTPSLFAEVRAFLSSFSFKPPVASPLVARASTETFAPQELTSSDERLGLFVYETGGGEMVLRFDAQVSELVGKWLVLYSGDWQRSAQLGQVPGEGYVMAELRLTQTELAELPPDAILSLRLDAAEKEQHTSEEG